MYETCCANVPQRPTRWCWIPEIRSSSGTRSLRRPLFCEALQRHRRDVVPVVSSARWRRRRPSRTRALAESVGAVAATRESSMVWPPPRRWRCRRGDAPRLHAVAATPSPRRPPRHDAVDALADTRSPSARTASPRPRRFAWPDLKRRRRDPDHAKDLVRLRGERPQDRPGSCRWNRGWLKGCFPNMPNDPSAPVRCSGSTMGSRDAMLTYVDAMLAASDEFMCHRRGIPPTRATTTFDLVWKA